MGVEQIQIGMGTEATEQVTQDLSASHVGSGTLRVYATPAMALFTERVCRGMIDPHLPQGQVTVGVHLDLHHLAPTPVGDTVRLQATITALDQGSVAFEVELRDSQELVGRATHRRAIIDVERFLKRVEQKAEQLQAAR